MKTKMTTIKKCPRCGGLGRTRVARYTDEARTEARRLRAQGLTLAEIGRQLGINHRQKVKNLIVGGLRLDPPPELE